MIKKILLIICSFFIASNTLLASSNGKDLYDMIKSNASDETIDFKVRTSVSLTNGVYITNSTDSGNDVYYYRGNVNNNVIFNNMCWKIIRTTETGGIKLIYNGLPSDGKCNNTGSNSLIGNHSYNDLKDDNTYVGYMYGVKGASTYEETHQNLTDSSMKIYLDDWYETNFTDINVTSKIEDTIFCNDRSTADIKEDSYVSDYDLTEYGSLGYGSNATLYGTTTRSWYLTNNPSPSLKCSRNDDKFTTTTALGNGKLTYPVGLITMDEAMYAGFLAHESGVADTKETNSYLYTGVVVWTMSPIWHGTKNIASMGYLGNNGYNDSGQVPVNRGVRPVISLINGVAVKDSEDGSENNPYTISYYSVHFENSEIETQYLGLTNDEKVIKPSDPVKEGYEFLGWYKDSKYKELYDFDSVVDKPITLYAKWKKIENPQTADNIYTYIIFGISSLFGIILMINKKLKRDNI